VAVPPGRREREFTLGRFERSYVGSTPLVALHAADGHVAAFVNEIPAYQPGQATIDLMRHRADLAHGAMDYIVVELLLLLKGEGYRSFNLGLAPFAGVGDRPGATLYERAIHQLFEHLNRFFSYAGLRHYKAKFEPAWEDRFLVYQGGAPGLVKAALAVVRATEG
jgi:phosphatidylglycerol lysyltransferase